MPGEDPLEYYASPGLLTDPLEHSHLFTGLPTDVRELCAVVQGVMLRIFWAQRYGVELGIDHDPPALGRLPVLADPVVLKVVRHEVRAEPAPGAGRYALVPKHGTEHGREAAAVVD